MKKNESGLSLFLLPIQLEFYFLKIIIIVLDNIISIIIIIPANMLKMLLSQFIIGYKSNIFDMFNFLHFFITLIPLLIILDVFTDKQHDNSF